MKKIFLLLIVATFTQVCNAQKLSLNEIITLLDKDFDYFDTYVTSKGFEFLDNDKKPEMKFKVAYAYKRTATNKAEYFIDKKEYYDAPQNVVAYQTSFKNVYLDLKKQITLKGFKYVDSEVDGKAVFYNYTKGSYKISLGLSPTTDERGNQRNVYEVSISK
ncbi:MAG: hypothetical protein ACTHMD_01650 [Flavisolibacter sp.]